LWAVAYGDGAYVVVGVNGAILQSDNAIPALLAGRFTGEGFEVSLTGEVGRSYRLQVATNLSPANWADLVTMTNTSPPNPFTDSAATNFRSRFYRAVSP